jgi:hypothetical protein
MSLARRKPLLILALLTLAALFVHGYHPFAEDGEIYLPGVKKLLHPQLFPTGAEFFESHAHLTIFPYLIALPVRFTHLPFNVVLLLWYLASVFLLLLACWELTGLCFTDVKARWAGVMTVAGMLTLPVAGTALYIMDQYINTRNIAAFAAVFAVVRVLEKKYLRAGLWLVFAAACHPLMAVFAISYCVLLIVMEWLPERSLAAAALFPLGFSLHPSSPAYHQSLTLRSYFYVTKWAWYEQLGIIVPIPILWWFGRVAGGNVRRLCRALIVYDLIFLVAALVLDIPPQFESMVRLEPLRSLHLLYIIMLVIGGGLLGQYVLQGKIWRWLVLFVPMCAGMFFAQRQLFPGTPQVEWPWGQPKNLWEQAFVWSRDHTPVDAVFALDPAYERIPGEDTEGFRAIAERSRMADAVKDSGAVSMFPELAGEWLSQVQALQGWRSFTVQDFQRLHDHFGVSWVVLQKPGVSGLNCPYQNQAVMVCRIE